MVKVIVKFSKDSHEIQIEEDDNLESFQAKVYALTTVPPKSMKLLLKGKQIKDDEAVKALKDGLVITLFGTQEDKALKKIEAVKPTQIEKKAVDRKEYYGLENLGNTCYLNAGVQLLRGIPQLRQWTSKTKFEGFGYSGAIGQLGKIWQKLEKDTVSPKEFVMMFLMMNQQFGPLGKQQDSQEFVQKMIEYFQKVGKFQNQQGSSENVSTHFFELEFQEHLKNKELPEEEQKVTISHALKLGCTIGGQIDLKIKSLSQGIKVYLNDTVEKSSPLDGQIHTYEKNSKINALSPYLLVQMVRFFWKEANELSGTKATSTKITKAIDFGLNLDLYEFCSDSLKQKLNKGRQYDLSKKEQKKKLRDNRLQDFRQKHKDANMQQRELFKQFKHITEQEDIKEHDEELYRAHGLGLDTGEYNLIGVITHQGLSADSGHYLAWVHQSGLIWNQYNDDLVTEHKQEDVLNLKGGLSNNQMAYLLLYRKREVM